VSRSATVGAVDRAQVIAELLRDTYGEASLDTGVTEPTVVQEADGSRSLVLPRDRMPEPLRSLHLIGAAAIGTTLVATFRWGEDDTVFVLPYDTRDLDADVEDTITVRTFLTQLVEHTLGGPRESWEAARSTPVSRRLAVVRPWNAG
jgi:hypothetical protein